MLKIKMPLFDESLKQRSHGVIQVTKLKAQLETILTTDKTDKRKLSTIVGAALVAAEEANYRGNDAGTYSRGGKKQKVLQAKQDALKTVYDQCAAILDNDNLDCPARLDAVENYLLSLMPEGVDTRTADYVSPAKYTGFSVG